MLVSEDMTEMIVDTEAETTVELPRFGTCTFRDSEVIAFPWGLPGFGSLRRFLALHLDGQENFVWLQSLDDVTVALPTTDPYSVFPDYNPQLPLYASSSLDIQRPEEFILLGVVVVGPGAEAMTMNLLAPIVINLRSRVARQITLETGGYAVRTAIPRKAPASPAGA
jgi:flagellar assembly factor FliW